MTCVSVMYLNRPFSEADQELGLTKAAEILSASSAPSAEVILLVGRGYEYLSGSDISRLRDCNFRVIDAGRDLSSVRRRFDFANDDRIWRGEIFHEMCFLRWLIIEEFFGNQPVLAFDIDVVWRLDPLELFNCWIDGGSFTCNRSPCVTFIKDKSWYESYRSGLDRLSKEEAFGGTFKKDHFKGLYHDQALIQFLIKSSLIENDELNFTSVFDRYAIYSNPLSIGLLDGGGKVFSQNSSGESIDGKQVPFWHFQQRFSRYLFGVAFVRALFPGKTWRVPYDRDAANGTLSAQMLQSMAIMLQKEKIAFISRPLDAVRGAGSRSGIYEMFFEGDLAQYTFTDDVWWNPGVWAH